MGPESEILHRKKKCDPLLTALQTENGFVIATKRVLRYSQHHNLVNLTKLY